MIKVCSSSLRAHMLSDATAFAIMLCFALFWLFFPRCDMELLVGQIWITSKRRQERIRSEIATARRFPSLASQKRDWKLCKPSPLPSSKWWAWACARSPFRRAAGCRVDFFSLFFVLFICVYSFILYFLLLLLLLLDVLYLALTCRVFIYLFIYILN